MRATIRLLAICLLLTSVSKGQKNDTCLKYIKSIYNGPTERMSWVGGLYLAPTTLDSKLTVDGVFVKIGFDDFDSVKAVIIKNDFLVPLTSSAYIGYIFSIIEGKNILHFRIRKVEKLKDMFKLIEKRVASGDTRKYLSELFTEIEKGVTENSK